MLNNYVKWMEEIIVDKESDIYLNICKQVAKDYPTYAYFTYEKLRTKIKSVKKSISTTQEISDKLVLKVYLLQALIDYRNNNEFVRM